MDIKTSQWENLPIFKHVKLMPNKNGVLTQQEYTQKFSISIINVPFYGNNMQSNIVEFFMFIGHSLYQCFNKAICLGQLKANFDSSNQKKKKFDKPFLFTVETYLNYSCRKWH